MIELTEKVERAVELLAADAKIVPIILHLNWIVLIDNFSNFCQV